MSQSRTTSLKSNAEDSSDNYEESVEISNTEKDLVEDRSMQILHCEEEDQNSAADEPEESTSQDIWIPPASSNIISQHQEVEWMTGDTLSQEEKLIILLDELEMILESDEYDDSLRKSLRESNPGYLKIIEKRRKDLLKEDHGIVVAGETSAGKSTLINKILQKRIFKAKLRESTSTICKIRNSEEVKIITERINGKLETITLTEKCNLETEDGQKLLRDTLEKLTDMTSTEDSKNFRSVDVGFPIPFLKGNTIIVDTPGIGGSGDLSKKLMEYLPNAVSFIFVVDVASAGGMQNDRLPHILRSIIQLQVEDEMPCFDPGEVIFITNKWDNIGKEEDSSDNDEKNTWEELKKEIKTSWPSVKEENIFKMSLIKVTPQKTNSSTEEFEKFQLSLRKIIKKNENIRLLQHLRFLHELLKNVIKGIDSGLALGKKSEKEQRALAESHKERIKELITKCKEEGTKLRENFRKIIENSAEEVYDYMSTGLGKDRILNPPGQMSLMDIPYIPNMFSEQIKARVQMYVQGVLQSEENQEKFLILKERVLAFYTEMSSDISEMENDWTEYSEGTHAVDVEEGSIVPYVAGVIATSPLWIPLLAIAIGLAFATLGVGIAASPVIAPVIGFLGRKERRQRIIDEEFEMCRSTIRSTICNHLESVYKELFENLIQKTINKILPRRIKSLEKMIHELSENRQQILANQETLERLSRKLKSIEQRKLEIQMSVESII
ncbi:uncharacterized protein LOC133189405 [Saccostrea echinata]|uniref:uncharacterized protein LOC133189405 n=1 Tax=Saccostrea echinata TaxID=191078 RepID=UPI002A7FAD84|nr:uncharacterized protein LOC133189405 [Saccostrea echinata]